MDGILRKRRRSEETKGRNLTKEGLRLVEEMKKRREIAVRNTWGRQGVGFGRLKKMDLASGRDLFIDCGGHDMLMTPLPCCRSGKI